MTAIGSSRATSGHDLSQNGYGVLLLLLLLLLLVVVVVVRTRVSDHSRARMQRKKMGQCQCTDPFGWTDQPAKNPTPFPSEDRFQASLGAKPSPQFQVEEKDCEARQPHSPLLRRKGGRNLFHRLGVECSWSGMLTGGTLTRVFLVRRTLLTMLLPSPTE